MTTGDETVWHRYRRRGEVTAQRRRQPWTWITSTGEVMRAQAGDCAVTDNTGAGGEQWPVPDDQFRKSYDGPID